MEDTVNCTSITRGFAIYTDYLPLFFSSSNCPSQISCGNLHDMTAGLKVWDKVLRKKDNEGA
jgi:hypothetical protein